MLLDIQHGVQTTFGIYVVEVSLLMFERAKFLGERIVVEKKPGCVILGTYNHLRWMRLTDALDG